MRDIPQRLLCCMTITAFILFCIIYNANVSCEAYASNLNPYKIIIDAGHGGEDGGAVAPNGVYESSLNLDIALREEMLLAFLGTPPIMTRRSDTIDYPPECNTIKARKKADQQARASQINELDRAVLISIHQNYYPSGQPHGAQALYNTIPGSKELADMIQNDIKRNLEPDNSRGAEKISETIYLMRASKHPSILLECGFLSNRNDLARLESKDYQIQLAAIIAVSTLRYCNGVGI